MPHWTIDLERNEVRDAAGGHVALRRRSFELLLYLARRHDRLVSKAELIEENWRGLAVTDDSLTKCISDIRQALGDGLRDTVRTVSGRGYMLSGWHKDATGQRLTSGVDARALGAPRLGNLPVSRPLIGRDEAIERVATLVTREQLVTVLGPGGIGKTSLAVAAATAAAPFFADGIFVVELSPLTTGAPISGAIAAALRIGISGDPLAAVAAHVSGKQLLVVLDNCEHLVADVAEVAVRLLNTAPRIAILATSREPLAIGGEKLYRLSGLTYPDSADGLSAAHAVDYPAVQLLEQHAGLVVDGYALADADVPAAVEVCRRLDGIPLAIVLAGARLDIMSVSELAQSLDRRFDLLTNGPRGADERQRTLRAMVDWSVNLLTPDERALFAELGVFVGPVSAEDITAVCRVDGRPPTINLILALAGKSLLSVHRSSTSRTRYGYFETTRHFALEQLSQMDPREARCRHAAYLVDVFRRSETEVEHLGTDVWRGTYLPYLDNLRAALEWSFSPNGDAKLAVELVARSGEIFDELCLHRERGRWAERAECLPESANDPALLGRLKLWLACPTGGGGFHADLSLEAAALFAQAGEALWEGRGRAMAAFAHAQAGASDQAWREFADAEQLLRPLGNTRSLNDLLRSRAMASIRFERYHEAEADLDEAIQVADAIGFITGAVWARRTLLDIPFVERDLKSATALETEAARIARDIGSLSNLLDSLTYLAGYYLSAGDANQARPYLCEAFDLSRNLDHRPAMRLHTGLVGFYLALSGNLSGAMSLTAFALAADDQPDYHARRFEKVMRERLPGLLAPMANDIRLQIEVDAKHWSLDRAVAVALAALAET